MFPLPPPYSPFLPGAAPFPSSCCVRHVMSHPKKSNGPLTPPPTLPAHADIGPACVAVGITCT